MIRALLGSSRLPVRLALKTMAATASAIMTIDASAATTWIWLAAARMGRPPYTRSRGANMTMLMALDPNRFATARS